jgi:hypothetical protein
VVPDEGIPRKLNSYFLDLYFIFYKFSNFKNAQVQNKRQTVGSSCLKLHVDWRSPWIGRPQGSNGGERPRRRCMRERAGGLTRVPQTVEQGRRDNGCRWRCSLAWGKWRRSSGNLMEETMQRQGPAAPKLGGRRLSIWSLAATAWRWPTRSGMWRSSSLAEKWRSGHRRGVLHFSGRRCSMTREMVAVLALMTGVGVNLSRTTRMGLGAGE